MSDSVHALTPFAAAPLPAQQAAAQQASQPTQTASAASGGSTGADGSGKAHHHFTFHDFLDTINPLQHLPVISTIYQHLTGDKLDSNTARVVGDTIYGGPVGLVAGLIDAHMVNQNGKDMGDRVLAYVQGDSDKGKDGTAQMADASTTATSALPGNIPGVGGPNPGQIGMTGLVNAARARPAGTIDQSVTLSALPSKPQPMVLPHLPPVGSYLPGQPAATALAANRGAAHTPNQSGSTNIAAQLASLSVPGAPTTQSSFLPSMGSPATAAALATAAPVTPQTVQLQGLAPQTGMAPQQNTTSQNPMPLPQQRPMAMPGAQHGIAIDTSPQGIMAMHANAHAHAPVPLQLPSGVLPSVAASAAPTAPTPAAAMAGNDFVARMKLGLEKYQAMMKQQNAATGGTDVTGKPATGDAAALAASANMQSANMPAGLTPASMATVRKPPVPAMAQP
ncbi:MAG TPA: hypothetical protein VL574_09495 [Stellaceae bacterium]|nr:hypothetical protein [Stellaceae bacterium]